MKIATLILLMAEAKYLSRNEVGIKYAEPFDELNGVCDWCGEETHREDLKIIDDIGYRHKFVKGRMVRVGEPSPIKSSVCSECRRTK